MKKNQLKDLATKTAVELGSLIEKTMIELIRLKMDWRAGKLKDVQAVNKKRHDLARLKTAFREKQLKENL